MGSGFLQQRSFTINYETVIKGAFKTMGFFLILWVAVAISWIGNVVALTDCDFKADYKCEAIHAVGLIPVASLVTVWLPTDKDHP